MLDGEREEAATYSIFHQNLIDAPSFREGSADKETDMGGFSICLNEVGVSIDAKERFF